ncbi:Vanillyl-alcohol oxidase [Fusarium oxysporum f. sp. albedinis]|nr:Vanillyl-alcohol oxidase [Fusarium oxysporum f. sp. albedinis]
MKSFREVALLPHVNIYEHFFACVLDIELNCLILLDQIAVIPQALIEEELLFHFALLLSIDDFTSGWTDGLESLQSVQDQF